MSNEFVDVLLGKLWPGEARADGVDVVIQSLGVSAGPEIILKPTWFFSKAKRVLLTAMEEAQVKRLICVTGFGAMTRTVYKICERALWEEGKRTGILAGAGADVRDGFIHLSTAAQVRETAAKHFAGAPDLMLIAIDAAALDGALRWERSRGGDLFPHLYGALPLTAVMWAQPLPLGADRRHRFPERMA